MINLFQRRKSLNLDCAEVSNDEDACGSTATSIYTYYRYITCNLFILTLISLKSTILKTYICFIYNNQNYYTCKM